MKHDATREDRGAGHAMCRRSVLTNADLERMVDTTNEWILQRTGIRERHIVDPGVATSDIAVPAALEAIDEAGLTPDDIGLHRRRHDDAGHDLSEHRVHAAGEDRREERVGLRPRRRLFRVHLLAQRRRVDGRDRRRRARAGRRRRRHVEHHRLHRSRDVHPVRRRRRAPRCCRRPTTASRRSSTSCTSPTAPAGRRCACRPAAAGMPASHETVDKRLHYVKQDGQTVFKFAVKMTEEISRRMLERNELTRRRSRPLRLAPGEPAHHRSDRRTAWAAARQGRHQPRELRQHDRRHDPAGALPTLAPQGRLKKGDLVLLASVGAGFTVGAVLLRWSL